MELNKQMLPNQLKELSIIYKDVVLYVRCFNYCDKNCYYLKNGKVSVWSGFKPHYDFMNNKTTFSKLNKDGIYIACEWKH